MPQSFGPRNRLFRPPAGSRTILEGEALDLPKKTAAWTRFCQRCPVRRAAGTRSRCRPVHIQAYKGFGIIPTPMTFTEVFTAMQQGTVDEQENPLSLTVANKFEQVQKHLSRTAHMYSPGVFLMNKAAFEKLAPAD